jgi:DNA-binding NtrC family response regulator
MKTAILSVDDDILVLNSLRIQLERHFGETHLLEFAQNVDEAIGVIDDITSTGVELIVIISDWIMPSKNGDVLAQHVKAINPKIQVVVLSGQLQEEKALALVESHTIDKVMLKPWSEEDLVNVIKNALKANQS